MFCDFQNAPEWTHNPKVAGSSPVPATKAKANKINGSCTHEPFFYVQ